MPQTYISANETEISENAAALAKAFLKEGEAKEPTKEWDVGFVWYLDRRYREKGTNNWHRMPAGFDLCLFERSKLPKNAIWKGEPPLIVEAPIEVLKKFRDPIIDILSTSPVLIGFCEKKVD